MKSTLQSLMFFLLMAAGCSTNEQTASFKGDMGCRVQCDACFNLDSKCVSKGDIEGASYEKEVVYPDRELMNKVKQ